MTEIRENSKISPWTHIRRWTPIVLACAFITAYSCKSNGIAPPINLSWRDKLDHLCVYGLLGVLVLQALPPRLQGIPRWMTAFLLVSCFGLFDEIVQHHNPSRTGDPLDWLADSIGALTTIVLYTAIPKIRAIAEFRPISQRRKST